MAIRLIECRRILKDTGSIYLHCDPTMSHYLKLLLDCVFGEKRFKNEIVWCYTGPSNTKRYFPRKHDVIFYYSKGDDWIFNADAVRVPYVKLETGKTSGIFKQEATLSKAGKIPESWWDDLTPVGRIKNERTNYPTQKPRALVERMIKASSNEGDMVLDPFCGCATACVAAENLNRQWIGVDISIKAYELVQKRLGKEIKCDLFDPKKNIGFHTDPPTRTDTGEYDAPQKWVYVISNDAYADFYKVGIAQDWKSRLNGYQTADPNRGYRVEYKRLTPHFREIEKHVHDTLPGPHEWVNATLDEIVAEIEGYKG